MEPKAEHQIEVTGGNSEAQSATRAVQQWSEEEWRAWNSWSWGRRGDAWSWYASWENRARDAGNQRGENGCQPDPWSSWDPWSGQEEDGWKSKPWWQQGKGDFSDPPQWPSWTHYRLWRRAVQRWGQNTDVPTYRRAEKLLKGMDWQMQQHFDHLSERTLSSPEYLSEILKILDVLAGERENTEMRRTIRAALYQGHRRADESLAQYSLRRDAEFCQASKFLPFPDELKAVMLEEQANISKQALQNIRVRTNGQNCYEATRRAMQIMDVGDDSLFKQGGKQGYLTEESYTDLAAPAQAVGANFEVEKSYVTDFDEDEDSVENFLFAAEEMGLGEEIISG